jgi:hypothetical protein
MPPVPLEAFQGLIGRLVSLGLVHAVWVGLLASAIAAIVFQTLPRLSHRFRYGLLAGTLGVVVIGPIVAVAIQRSTVKSRSVSGTASILVAATRLTDNPTPVLDTRDQSVISRPNVSIEGSLEFHRRWSLIIGGLEATQPFNFAAWLFGASILSARLMLAGFAIRRRVGAAGLASAAIQARADEFARRLKLRRMPPVLAHPGPTEPGLCGLFRPRILLPGPWLAGADAGRIDAILAHELAHARRLDLPANLLQRLVETALFFHPAVHWLSRALRRERELCADALAVALTGDPVSLASALESVARFRLTSLSSGRPAPLFGASLGGENLSLLPRIQELLGMTPNTPARRSLWPWVSLPVAGLFALLGASLGLAADPPKPADPAPTESSKHASVYGPPEPEFRIGQVETSSCPAQICFKIRYLSIGDPAWRDTVNDRLREIHRDAETTSWLLDEKAADDFVASLQGDQRNIVTGPNVTLLDGKLTTIDDRLNTLYVAELEKIENAKYALAFHPLVKSVELGPRIEIGGKIHLDSVLMNLDLRDTSLIAMHQRQTRATLKTPTKDPAEANSITGTYQVPVLSKKRYQGIRNMPDGTSLLINLGYVEERGEIPPMMDRAIEIVRTVVGGPRVEAERVVRERLVLITPKVFVFPREVKPFAPADQTSYLDFGTAAMY